MMFFSITIALCSAPTHLFMSHPPFNLPLSHAHPRPLEGAAEGQGVVPVSLVGVVKGTNLVDGYMDGLVCGVRVPREVLVRGEG